MALNSASRASSRSYLLSTSSSSFSSVLKSCSWDSICDSSIGKGRIFTCLIDSITWLWGRSLWSGFGFHPVRFWLESLAPKRRYCCGFPGRLATVQSLVGYSWVKSPNGLRASSSASVMGAVSGSSSQCSIAWLVLFKASATAVNSWE